MIRTIFLSTTAILGLAAAPVLAATHSDIDVSTMTCAELMAMDHDGMMAAASAVDMAMQDMSSGDDMAAEGEMAEGDAAPEDGAMAAEGDAMAADGAMADGDAMTEESMMKMEEACVGNEDMMVMDVMHDAM